MLLNRGALGKPAAPFFFCCERSDQQKNKGQGHVVMVDIIYLLCVIYGFLMAKIIYTNLTGGR